jgi:hypothetical protein
MTNVKTRHLGCDVELRELPEDCHRNDLGTGPTRLPVMLSSAKYLRIASQTKFELQKKLPVMLSSAKYLKIATQPTSKLPKKVAFMLSSAKHLWIATETTQAKNKTSCLSC